MRARIIQAILLVWSVKALGAQPELPGAPFSHQGVEIVWKATNQLPATLWIYKSVSGGFSPKAMTNMLALGRFTDSDKRKIPSHYPVRHKDLLHFESGDGTRRLDMIPSLGWVEYDDAKAVVAAKKDGPVQGVPSLDEAQRLALNLATHLEIEHSQLATKPNSSELKARFMAGTRGWFDKKLNITVKETNRVGINFTRRLDGLDFAGGWASGGLSVDFGNYQKVAKLNLSWRNLQRHEECTVATPNALVDRIKRGEARMVGPLLDAAQVKCLVITDVAPFYWAGIGDKAQSLVFPFAILTVTAELTHTNSVFEVNCNILSGGTM